MDGLTGVPPLFEFDPAEFLAIRNGIFLSTRTLLPGSNWISIDGRSILFDGVVVRGDLSQVAIGKYCVVERGAVIRPPPKKFQGGITFLPVSIGSHVRIGENSIVEAAMIGSNVIIGANCVVGKRTVIKDCVRILDNTVISPETVIPSYAIVGGVPGQIVGELPECAGDVVREHMQARYRHFTPRQSQNPS